MRYLTACLLAVPLAAGVLLTGTPAASAQTPNQPPVVTINAPSDGANFVPGAMIQFAGSAIDPETGPLGGVNMIWTSDRQGALGIGTGFSRNDLLLGAHVITLRATDPGGLQRAATVNITVGTPTATPTHTSTHTPTPMPTSTPVPPTNTPTRTATPVIPTSTPTRTPVPATNTPLPTATPRPPTATATHPATLPPPIASATAIAPTSTKSPAPTKTAKPTKTPTLTPTPRPSPSRPCADVTGDGRVTWRDIDRIARAIAARRYDSFYDVNADGRLTGGDIWAAVRQLGRHCHRDGGPAPTPTTPPLATQTPKPTGTPPPTKTPAPPTATPTPAVDPTSVPDSPTPTPTFEFD
jgi:hypothetical protein